MPTINFFQLIFVVIACVMGFVLLRPLLFGGRRIAAAVAYPKIHAGEAVLIDVREPDEWRSGVAAPAQLLPLSDLQGERRQWAPFLAANKDKELILYCASGIRSGRAALLLRKDGFKTANLGAFSRWRQAGLPTRNA
jgi:rhodanese-related sulfurtransferase